MENRGERATKNPRKYAFIAIFVRFPGLFSADFMGTTRQQRLRGRPGLFNSEWTKRLRRQCTSGAYRDFVFLSLLP